MSREVRRVPLDFDTPIGETWPGYFMPAALSEDPCPLRADGSCNNGVTSARAWADQLAHLILMLDDDLEDQERFLLREVRPAIAAHPRARTSDASLLGRPQQRLWVTDIGSSFGSFVISAGALVDGVTAAARHDS